MAVGGLGSPGLFLLRGLGTLAASLGIQVAFGTEPQGTSRLMCAARGLNDVTDYVGSLNLLAGTTKLGAVGALVLLGATSSEVVGGVNELAGVTGHEHAEAMRLWAASGNF